MDIITYAMIKGTMNGKIAAEVAKAIAELPKGATYCGAVNYQTDLPNDASVGDTYTVKYQGTTGTTTDGTEYIWGPYEGSNVWIALGPDPSRFLVNPGGAQAGDVLSWDGTKLQWREPLPINGNVGQVLTKTQDYWEWANVPTELPSFNPVSDIGKVLTIGSTGNLEWTDPSTWNLL